MNQKSLAVLSAIYAVSKDGQSAIIEKEELLQAVPAVGTVAALREVIRDLALTGHIAFKYEDAESVCVATEPKGRLLTETEQKVRENDAVVDPAVFRLHIDYKKIAKYSFVAAFLGALIAGGILLVLAIFLL